MKSLIKKMLLLTGMVSYFMFASSFVMASENKDKPLTVRRNDGVTAKYWGKETIFGTDKVMYSIFLFRKNNKHDIIPFSVPVKEMSWNDKGFLNVTWHDGTSGVLEIKK